jgi:hypothetical protein
MRYRTTRPNLQVYIKGQIEPVSFEGEYLEIDDTKIEKILDKIEGVTKCEVKEDQQEVDEKNQDKKKAETENMESADDEVETEQIIEGDTND